MKDTASTPKIEFRVQYLVPHASADLVGVHVVIRLPMGVEFNVKLNAKPGWFDFGSLGFHTPYPESVNQG